MGPFVAHRSSHDPDEVVEILKPVAPGVSISPLSKEFRFDAKLTRLAATGLFRVRMDATNVLHGPHRAWVSVTVPQAPPARFALVEPRRRVDCRSPLTGMINPVTRLPVPGSPDDKRVLHA